MKLQSEWAKIPNICALCKQHREQDEYCILVSSLSGSKCVIQKKSDARLVYKETKDEWGVVKNIRYLTEDGWKISE